MNQSPHPKNTPGRRRQGRNSSTPQKAYVSENDLPAYKLSNNAAHFDSPNTPQKSGSSTQKPRNKNNKTRTKNGAVSPSHQAKHTNNPPLPTEPQAPIFAGSTFHASPAPSSLPMPSFLARSSVESPLGKTASPLAHATPSPQQEPSPPSTDSEDAQVFGQPSLSRHEESPLEVFFRAQREEKAKGSRAKSANAANQMFAPGPFSPPHDSPVPTEPRTLPRSQAQRNAGPGISAIELDGTPGRPVLPAFSTPYQERIRAARSTNGSVKTTPAQSQSPQYDESQALLRMLHHGKPPVAPAPHNYPQQHQHPVSAPVAPGFQQHLAQQSQPAQHNYYSHQQTQSPQAHPGYGMFPPTIVHGNPNQSNNSPSHRGHHAQSPPQVDQISRMEASLRQVLKLDPSS